MSDAPDDYEYDPASFLIGCIAELRGIPLDEITEGTLTERAIVLHRLRFLSSLALNRAALIEQELIDAMETDRVDIPGLGEIVREEVERGSWRDSDASERMREDLSTAVANSIALDVATGEYDQMKRNVALAAMRAAYEAIPSFSSLKVAGRRRFGLHLSDYRDSTTGYKVTVLAFEED